MTTFEIAPPSQDQYDPFYQNYITAASEQDIWQLLKSQSDSLFQLFDQVPESETQVLHAPYTWTLREVIGHLIDVERTFSFRLMHVAVGNQNEGQPAPGDALPLVGMEQDQYVKQFHYKNIDSKILLEEFRSNRQSTLFFINRLQPQMLDRKAEISGCMVTARALIFKIAGHVRYHQKIMAKRLNKTI